MTINLPQSIECDCSEYLNNYIPIYKYLPVGGVFKRVKVRNKNNYLYKVEQKIDKAFAEEYQNLSRRSVVASTSKDKATYVENATLYRIYPINGYRILYNPVGASYKDIVKPLDNIQNDINLSNELFQLAFVEGSLTDAAENESDIIIYGIKYFYAIDANFMEEITNGLKQFTD